MKLALNKQRLTAYTVREIIEIKKKNDLNLEGKERIYWILELAILSGRTPESIKNFLKTLAKMRNNSDFIRFLRMKIGN